MVNVLLTIFNRYPCIHCLPSDFWTIKSKFLDWLKTRSDDFCLKHSTKYYPQYFNLIGSVKNSCQLCKLHFNGRLKCSNLFQTEEAIPITNLDVSVENMRRCFCFFFFFFFCVGFLSRTFTNHRTAGEGGWYFINSSLLLPPASQTLRH